MTFYFFVQEKAKKSKNVKLGKNKEIPELERKHVPP